MNFTYCSNTTHEKLMKLCIDIHKNLLNKHVKFQIWISRTTIDFQIMIAITSSTRRRLYGSFAGVVWSPHFWITERAKFEYSSRENYAELLHNIWDFSILKYALPNGIAQKSLYNTFKQSSIAARALNFQVVHFLVRYMQSWNFSSLKTLLMISLVNQYFAIVN